MVTLLLHVLHMYLLYFIWLVFYTLPGNISHLDVAGQHYGGWESRQLQRETQDCLPEGIAASNLNSQGEKLLGHCNALSGKIIELRRIPQIYFNYKDDKIVTNVNFLCFFFRLLAKNMIKLMRSIAEIISVARHCTPCWTRSVHSTDSALAMPYFKNWKRWRTSQVMVKMDENTAGDSWTECLQTKLIVTSTMAANVKTLGCQLQSTYSTISLWIMMKKNQ